MKRQIETVRNCVVVALVAAVVAWLAWGMITPLP
jgi:hypothetical protein